MTGSAGSCSRVVLQLAAAAAAAAGTGEVGSAARCGGIETFHFIFVLKSVCPQRNLRYRPPRGSLGLREKQ